MNTELKDSEHIAKILIDPKDGNTVYVCATGHLWDDNEERGVYKTTDGGKSWRRVLAEANASTGCDMLEMSEQDPKTIYAALWDLRRQAWTFRSGGPGSGLFKSTDRGEHWGELTSANANGLPEKPYGRIALAVAASRPQVVYAMIESKKSALFRSDDGGQNWTRLDASQDMIWRPFYFANLIVDPKDENKVFKIDAELLLSVNGGRSFSPVSSAARGDFHDVWIDPGNPNLILAGDDGGLWRSDDGGTRWEHFLNLPSRNSTTSVWIWQSRTTCMAVCRTTARGSNLLFLGTEFGLWISIDGGQNWAQYKGGNFAAVAVRDLVVHPRSSGLVLATHGRGIWIIDDISPLRALTPALMSAAAAFLPAPKAVQWMQAFGGWPEGDAAFNGPSRPNEAFIPYYQRSRHICGDLKIEIFDGGGKLVDTVPSSMHRGVTRATWSMRLKPPKVPPAASAAPGASTGPRILPGMYTVKMNKNEKVYTTQVNVVLAPRAEYTLEDRRAQFKLVTRLAALLNHMSCVVDAVVAVRDGAAARATGLPETDPLRQKLQQLSNSVDQIRSKIVATKEGGMITGEERLREFLGGLYGDVNGYEGRPTDSQMARADLLARELEDVIREFTELTNRELPSLNQELEAKKLGAVRLVSEAGGRRTESEKLAAGKLEWN